MRTPVVNKGWHDEHFATHFADRRRLLLPLLDLQEDVIRQLLSKHDRAIGRFLDLGAGAGAMSELVLSSQPRAEGVLVDFSEHMLARAKVALSPWAGRWRLLHADLSDPAWRAGLPGGRYDAVISGLAIHHLCSARKQELFGELFALLEPGGILINMDYVAIVGPLRRSFDKLMHANAVRAERDSGGVRTDAEIELDDGEDRPDPLEDQLQWLRSAGFEQVEVHFKWAEASVFGGVRAGPDTPRAGRRAPTASGQE
jgi:tRNA (cmo5U34)-methyltransferase